MPARLWAILFKGGKRGSTPLGVSAAQIIMKMIKIGDLHITIAAYDEPLAITDFVCHLVGEERTSNVNITITPDNQVKIRYKPEKKEDRLDMMLKTAPESVQQAHKDFKLTAKKFAEAVTQHGEDKS